MEYWTNLGRDIPLVLRLAVAAGVGVLAIRWIVLVPIAFVLSMPILGLHTLAILVCVAPPVTAWLQKRAGAVEGPPSVLEHPGAPEPVAVVQP
jgi:hypothetical protein